MNRRPEQRHHRWLSEEEGAFRKSWGGRVRVALAFPNGYAVGMSNLGFQSVYRRMNLLETVVCERVLYPEPGELPLFRSKNKTLTSLESSRPVLDFHLLAFSAPFENDYPNILEMLDFAGIPLETEDRGGACPLVAGGGIALFLNPEPLAAFMDFMFMGEAEGFLEDFFAFWLEDPPPPRRGSERRSWLSRLARAVEGIYAPSLYRPFYGEDGSYRGIEPQTPGEAPGRVSFRRSSLKGETVCRTCVVTPQAEFSNVRLLEIGRGCGRGCRFCAAGYVYRPPRHRELRDLVESAEAMGIEPGSRVGLVSAAVSDHPRIDELCAALRERGASLSFSSLRADSLTPGILEALKAGGHRAVAIAPEAGSERLRRVVNKHLEAEQIFRAAERLTEAGVLSLKLYFMIGLPTEDREDLEAIVDLVKTLKHRVLRIGRGLKRMGNITVSVHSFVPKAFTPFQWAPFAGVRELKQRARRIRNALGKVPNVRVHFDLPKWAYVQALLARGDRRSALLLKKVVASGMSWTQAMREAPLNADFWVARERAREEPFPWEIVDHGLRRDFLWSEYRRALEGKASPGCEPDSGCRRCGICEKEIHGRHALRRERHSSSQ